MSANKSIIIKKVKKSAGGGHHGGAWKVAYADFVTAMMAFFLLMWLLHMSSDEKRVRLSQYFKHFSIYTEGGTSFMGKSSEIFNESGESASKVFRNPKGRDVQNIENKAKQVETGISGELGGAAEQVIIDTTNDGIRIQIMDRDGSEMFEQGKNSLTPRGKEVLKSVGNNIKELPNKVSIEGHTDSTPMEKKDYSNWELSAERALTARRVLEISGLKSKRFTQVGGFADNELLVKDNPADPSNRRISIILHRLEETAPEEENLFPPKYSLDNPAGNNIKLTPLVKGKTTATVPPEIREKEEAVPHQTTAQPVIREDWIPVIDESDNQPVLDKGWTPVIEGDDKAPVKNREISEPVLKEEKLPEAAKEYTGSIEKLPYMKFYEEGRSTKKSTFVDELANPVISGGAPR